MRRRSADRGHVDMAAAGIALVAFLVLPWSYAGSQQSGIFLGALRALAHAAAAFAVDRGRFSGAGRGGNRTAAHRAFRQLGWRRFSAMPFWAFRSMAGR